MTSDNGIKNVTGDTRDFSLDPRARIVTNIDFDFLMSQYGSVTNLDQRLRTKPNDVTDLGHSGQWQISRYHQYYNDHQYYDYIIAKTNDVVDSKSFDDLKQFMAQHNITGRILYLDTPTQDAPMEIPRDMIDTMDLSKVFAKSMLQGDYSKKKVSIEIPNKEVVHLGKIKASMLTLYTGPSTRHVDFTNVNFTQGDAVLVDTLDIRPCIHKGTQVGNITLDSPLSGAFGKVTIASLHDVIIER